MITVNMNKAKVIAHGHRRIKRDKDYLAVDGGTMYATLNAAGKVLRTKIRNSDDKLQLDIESATNPSDLKQLMVDGDLLKD